LFLRGLALTYFFAFASLLPQLIGLVGDNGLLPARDAYPTFLFFNVNDTFLRILPWIGIGLALMLFFRIVPMAAVAGLLRFVSDRRQNRSGFLDLPMGCPAAGSRICGDTRYAFWLETFSIAHPLHALVSGPCVFSSSV
jgi:hypothetical protein